MLSHKRIQIAFFKSGLLAAAAILVACQTPAVVANDSAEQSAFQMVHLQVSIAVSDNGTDTRILDQLQLTTVAGSKAEIQLGQQVAVPTGVTSLPGNRGSSRSYSQQQVGTLVVVQPQIIRGQIVVQLQLEKSWVEAPMTDAEADITSRYTTFSTQANSTLALSDGKPLVMKANVSGAPGGQREAVISVTASLKSQPATHAALDKPQPQNLSKRSNKKPPGQSSTQKVPTRGAVERATERDSRKMKTPKADPKTPITSQPSGIRRMFEMIDQDKDGIISSPEWTMNTLARSIASRGVKYSEKMGLQQFSEAVSEMKKGFSKDRDPKQKPDSPRS